MDKQDLVKAVERVRRGHDGDADVMAIASALERYLLHEGRRRTFDKRGYQKDYMRRWRARKKEEAKRKRGRR